MSFLDLLLKEYLDNLQSRPDLGGRRPRRRTPSGTNLTLGTLPIGRSDSRTRPEGGPYRRSYERSGSARKRSSAEGRWLHHELSLANFQQILLSFALMSTAGGTRGARHGRRTCRPQR
jgi:hypothetical protein